MGFKATGFDKFELQETFYRTKINNFIQNSKIGIKLFEEGGRFHNIGDFSSIDVEFSASKTQKSL